MELTTIRELFKNREEYLDKEVTVGDGSEAFEILRHSDLSY